jgi:hypothetical protein
MSPLAIISIHLQGMTDSPSILTYHHLAPWLHGNLVLVDLMFNFEDPKNDMDSKLDCMLQEFEDGRFKEYLIFNLIFLQLIFQSGGLGSWSLSQATLIQTQETCTLPQTTRHQHRLMMSVLFCFLAPILICCVPF